MSEVRTRAADAVRRTAVGQFAFADVADAVLLAALDPEDEALVRVVGIAAWTADYSTYAGLATDAYRCDPNGCSGVAHAAHQGMERWQETHEDVARAAIAALKAQAQGEPRD